MASEAVKETKTAVNTESTDEEEISVITKAPPTKAEQDIAARHRNVSSESIEKYQAYDVWSC